MHFLSKLGLPVTLVTGHHAHLELDVFHEQGLGESVNGKGSGQQGQEPPLLQLVLEDGDLLTSGGLGVCCFVVGV